MQGSPSVAPIRRGKTLPPTLKFKPVLAPSLGYVSLSHSRISRNPFDPHVVATTNRTQIQELLSEKSKLGFAKLDDALSVFHRMAQIRHGFSVINFNQLLTAIAKMKHYSTVISLYKDKEICAVRIPVDDRTLNILVNCFCRLNQIECGFAILGIFYKCGYVPGVGTFNTLINGYVLGDKIEEAVELFGRLIRKGDAKPDEITYATIIKGLCKVGSIEMAVRLLRSMQKRRYRPTVEIYSTIINNLCKDRNVDDALRVLSEMREWDVMPNVFTYNSLIHGLCNAGRWKDATRMLGEMTGQNILPDVVTFNTLGLLKTGRCDAAGSVFHEMICSGQNPDILTYSVLVDGFFKNHQVVKALEVFCSMEDHGIVPNIGVYTILVNGLCKAGKIEDAWKHFCSFSSKGLKPDVKTYNAMIGGLCDGLGAQS
ncbi:hypothetical protein RHMOL_Rhmol02G0036300 [Rhododendron molle]|uniref:Uncharacterized protein n=1 Tax=Rhododendron molle TaxID=49168 RepID=A0ACC0PNT3_RHOML|nr:hypothetical protein RHMOL_Rhmol02G0036300 [Rhododendron molle]